jgi:hypothetical protein
MVRGIARSERSLLRAALAVLQMSKQLRGSHLSTASVVLLPLSRGLGRANFSFGLSLTLQEQLPMSAMGHDRKRRCLSGSLTALGEAVFAIECETEMRSSATIAASC